MEQIIRIGTRASRLALWQAEYVAQKLRTEGWQVAIVPVETVGDKILHKTIAKIGGKGIFTEELEQKLRCGEIDIAVHSAKDLPSSLPDGLEIIAYTEREPVHDVLVSYNKYFTLDESQKIVLGTSSTRRVAMIKHYMPKIKTVDVRGNLQTRMRKMEEGVCDALVLAYAGVRRMEYQEFIVMHLPVSTFTPAVGQGSIAVEASSRLDPLVLKSIRKVVNHEPTELRLRAERAFLRTLQGGCSIPSFALADFISPQELHINGGIISLNGREIVRAQQTGSIANPEAIGNALAYQVLEQGGEKILQDIRKQHV
ncbi:MAG: hydroxymethylbilane synthase [Cytophagales bacterium]|nr:hydroxymethylbilane synthase [Bernardetiaceae bacterium]MDW8204905.1 hydroxymethylbilane synthase [Cytophagales bacterium]